MDLDELDRQRKAEFKAYEMRKEHEKNLKLADLNSTQRAAEEAHLKEMEDKHKSHTKLHHPVSVFVNIFLLNSWTGHVMFYEM